MLTSCLPLPLLLLCLLLLICNNTTLADPALKMSRPPMGFMSWERFRCQVDCTQYPNECINEDLYRSTANAMVRGGYRDAGYTIVSIDDCWSDMQRTLENKLQPDPKRFPSGMQNLSHYLNQRGLQLGMYTDAGTRTCAGYPGSLGFEDVDVATFVDWGVHYIKVDGCYLETHQYPKAYTRFGRALKRNNSKMFYSCSWPAYLGDNETTKPYDEMYHVSGCNTWRNWHDVDNSWPSLYSIVMHWADYWQDLHNIPQHSFNDADMLLVGDDHYGKVLSLNKARLQMTFWALINSPLFIGGDVRTIQPPYRAILLNRDVIQINQNPGRPASCIVGCRNSTTTNSEERQVWVKTLLSNIHEDNPSSTATSRSFAFGFFNLGNTTATIHVSYQLEHDGDYVLPTIQEEITCRDLWDKNHRNSNLCRNSNNVRSAAPSSQTGWDIRYNDMKRTITITTSVGPTSQRLLQIDLAAAPVDVTA